MKVVILGNQMKDHMLTIIYLDVTTGYKTLNVQNSFALHKEIQALLKKGKFIICVIDQDSNHLVDCCDGFESHRKFIETCYHLEPTTQA